MHFWGGGVGHKATHDQMGQIFSDLHSLPLGDDDIEELPEDPIVEESEESEPEESSNEDDDEDKDANTDIQMAEPDGLLTSSQKLRKGARGMNLMNLNLLRCE